MKKYALLIGFCLLTLPLLSQQSQKYVFPRSATVTPSEIEEDYKPLLRRLEAPSPDGESYRAFIQRRKLELEGKERTGNAAASGKTSGTSAVDAPNLIHDFRGNTYINGVPNDNDFAISDGGLMVSVINSNMFYFDSTGNTLGDISLDAWSAPLGLQAQTYDPRAVYDPIHDRFIVVCLNGTLDSTSFIIVGFSQTNDPTAGWNLYALPGDPNNESVWTDYPIIAITEHEFFVTGNFIRNNEPWQTGFAGSICWQVRLEEGYNGDSIQTRLWDNVTFGGNFIRNLCVVQGGSRPSSATNMYLLSNRNFDAVNDTVFFMEITDTLNGNPQFLIDYLLTPTPYGLPPDATQRFNTKLATNDGRWLDAMIENDKIQFAGNSYVPGLPSQSGIYHGIIDNVSGTPTITGTIISDSTLNYGYPALAWCDLSPTGNDAMIVANYASPTDNPSHGVIFYDEGQGYSDLEVTLPGAGYINVLSGNVERWGDYSGLQPRYNEVGKVWSAATFGRSTFTYGTWIGEWTSPFIVSQDAPRPTPQVQAFPNPSQDFVKVQFEMDRLAFGEIRLVNLNGQVVKTFIRDGLRSGLNEFVFSTEPLENGIYFLEVLADGESMARKKIVVAH